MPLDEIQVCAPLARSMKEQKDRPSPFRNLAELLWKAEQVLRTHGLDYFPLKPFSAVPSRDFSTDEFLSLCCVYDKENKEKS